MTTAKRLGAGVAGLCALAGIHAAAFATQWPMERQNPQRTALAPGSGSLTNPAVRGRVYLGGDADALSTWMGDANQDGEIDIVMVVGGKVIMKDSHDRVLWDTVGIQAEKLFGAYDFDGNGDLELLVLGFDGLHLLDGRSGNVIWHVTDFMEGNNRAQIGGTRVADITGDGLPDIVLKAYWTSDGIVHAYSFAGGIYTDDPEANQVWEHDIEPNYDKGYFPTIGDVDDDGTPDVVSSTGTILEVFPASTGGASTFLVDLGRSIYYGRTQILNLDADPQNEIVHITSSSSKSLEIFDLVRVPDAPIVEVVWDDQDRIAVPTRAVEDLDGNGTFEIGISRYDVAAGKWEARLYQYVEFSQDPPSAMLDEVVLLENEQIVDFADITGDGKLEILTRVTTPGTPTVPAFYTIRAYAYENGATLLWELDQARWHFLRDRGEADLNPAQSTGTVARQDVDGDGDEELYVSRDADGDQKVDSLALLETSHGTVQTVAERGVDADTRMTIIGLAHDISGVGGGAEALAIDVSGRLWILGPGLETAGPGPLEVGGFYTHPAQVVDLDGDGTNELLVRKSSGLLTALQPEGTDQTGDADATLWSFDGNTSKQYTVVLDVDQDGRNEVVVRDNTDGLAPRLVLLDDTGAEIESLTLDSSPFNLLAAPFHGSSGPDVFGIQWTPEGQIELFVVDGDTWSLGWKTLAPYQDGAHADDNTAMAVDLDGDGTLDIGFGQDRYFCVASGATGDILGCANPRFYGGGAMTGPLDDGAAEDIALVSSDHVSVLDLDLNEQWSVDFEGIAGLSRQAAMADADGDGTLELYFLGDNSVYCYDNGVEAWVTSLQGGTNGEQSTSVGLNGMAMGDIDGDQVPEIVTGSTDGYLYALDGQTGDIEWAFELYYDVGRPVIGCVDDDALLDIAVPVGDGHLYLFNQATLETPGNVRDVAVQADLTLGPNLDDDVDESEVAESLGAAWDPVAGASGYLVAVVSEHATYVVDWQDVGNQTSVLITESRLLLGQQYHVLVQAYDSNHDGSPWARSDGVRIEDVSPPEVDDVHADPDPFNPDLTTTTITGNIHDLTGLAGYTVSVQDGDDVLFSHAATTSGTSRQVAVTWDGMDTDGIRVADGIYDIQITATDVAGQEASSTGTVEVTSRIPTPTPVPTPTPPAETPTPTAAFPTPTFPPTPAATPSIDETPLPGDDDTGEVEPTSPDPGGEASPTDEPDGTGSCNCRVAAQPGPNRLGLEGLFLLSPVTICVYRRRTAHRDRRR